MTDFPLRNIPSPLPAYSTRRHGCFSLLPSGLCTDSSVKLVWCQTAHLALVYHPSLPLLGVVYLSLGEILFQAAAHRSDLITSMLPKFCVKAG